MTTLYKAGHTRDLPLCLLAAIPTMTNRWTTTPTTSIHSKAHLTTILPELPRDHTDHRWPRVSRMMTFLMMNPQDMSFCTAGDHTLNPGTMICPGIQHQMWGNMAIVKPPNTKECAPITRTKTIPIPMMRTQEAFTTTPQPTANTAAQA
jgi:hypothetical protein